MFQRLHHVSYAYNLEYFYIFLPVFPSYIVPSCVCQLWNKEYMMMMKNTAYEEISNQHGEYTTKSSRQPLLQRFHRYLRRVFNLLDVARLQ